MIDEFEVAVATTIWRHNEVTNTVISIDFKGGESSSQFQWFTIAKIEL